MTTPKQPIPPALDHVWKTFLTTASGLDPQRTIKSAELAPGMPAIAPEPLPPPVTPSQLPPVPVEMPSATPRDSVAADFEVTGVLGEGGMGRVLLARQRSLQRDVALKVPKEKAPNSKVVDTLLTEAIITGSIEHPGIVPVHALGRDGDGRPVLVMKRIEGVSWRNLVDDPAHPAWASLAMEEGDRLDAHLEILMAVCNAAHFAHNRGIVHRDIKLDNVMIGGFGEIYLVDWGIAMRMLSPDERQKVKPEFGSPVGTMAYMAPEMALGQEHRIDARTDVYLLGASLHFVLTGKPRHVGEVMIEVLFSARDSEPVEYGPEVPAELAAICNRAMHADQDERFQTALELRQAIAAFRRHRGSIALSERAAARLAEIESFVNDHGQPAVGSDDERRLVKWMTESRFGFMQALAAWKGNQAAKTGLDRCLQRMIDYEIRQRSVGGARALLSELSDPHPEFERRIADLEIELQEAKAREERLQALERDSDLRIGAKFQMKMLAIIGTCLVASFFVLYTGDAELSQKQLIVFPAVLLTILLVAFAALRKQFVTSISRRLFALVTLMPLAMLVHRALALTHDANLSLILAGDMIITAAIATSMAITISPHLGWVAVTYLVGALASALSPARATDAFLICAGLTVIILGVLLRQLTRRPQA